MKHINSLGNTQKRKGSYIFLFILILLFIYSLVHVFWIVPNQKQEIRVQYIEEKNALRNDLDDLIDEHDNLLEQYGDLNIQLGKKDSIIRSQISEIRNLIRTKDDLKVVKEKIEILKNISLRYLSDIDSLFNINMQLNNQKDSVININKNINWKNYKLNKENKELIDKVNIGSTLVIGDIFVETIKYRNSGKELVTTKASKVIIIRTSFNIKSNLIADKGLKNIYIRYLDQNGNILLDTDKQQVFNADIELKQYSILKRIQYENKLLPVSIDFKRRDQLIAGDYFVEIYIDNSLLGTYRFNLK